MNSLPLTDREITVERLRYLTSDDLVKLIPSHKYGLMIEFREKIFCWKQAVSNILYVLL